MLAASAGLVALLAGAYFLPPAVRFRYHLWMRRRGRDQSGEHMAYIGRVVAARRMTASQITDLMGEPSRREERTLIYGCQGLHGYAFICVITLDEDGRAVKSEIEAPGWPPE
jgi:hypothetical protein